MTLARYFDKNIQNKTNSLITRLKEEKKLGEVDGVISSINHGTYLHHTSKLPNPKDIDCIICVELPDKELELDLYQIVSNNMIHGPCGNDFPFMPCMKNGKCSKGFPKDFTNDTY
uniref:Uncharacterized protein n=1 Tax=Lactuca sativa TaxID=4236 RepID=A0A9R1WLC3_LACSA|nr:hypothetical protein LSAT_V11C100019480 [Lactuca sativa]